MSLLFLWIGLTIILSFPLMGLGAMAELGAILMVIGSVLMIFEYLKR